MEKFCQHCGSTITGFERSTRKYCSDNCKQLAYYARNVFSQTTVDSGLSLNVKEDWAENGKKESILEMPVKVSRTETAIKLKYPEKFQRTVSSFLLTIENYRTMTKAEEYFITYTKPSYLSESVNWLSVRLLSITDNLIRIAKSRSISRSSLLRLSSALLKMKESKAFAYISEKYPFREMFLQLHEGFGSINKTMLPQQVPFSISRERKAEIIAVRFILSNFFKKQRFSELDFEYPDSRAEE